METILAKLQIKMTEYNARDPKRIAHLMKVHSFARLIGTEEKLSRHDQFILESVALVHDIGIVPSVIKYGNCHGFNQEKEGVAPCEKMLLSLGYAREDISRICFIVAHHHTYKNVVDICHQILLEADFIVNMHESALGKTAVSRAKAMIFKSESAKALLDLMQEL